MMKEYADKGLRWVVDYECQRPQSFLIENCQNIKIIDLTSKDSGFWNIHLLFSKNIEVRNVKVHNGKGPSTDGIDIDACENVLVENCYITCNDDNICIKAGRGLTSYLQQRVCRNIIVRNCVLGDGEGLTLGSEVSGGIENIRFENIMMQGTRVGFRIKSSRNRGGFIRNVHAVNLQMEDVKTPVQINLDWFPQYSYGAKVEGNFKDLPDFWQELQKDVKGEKGLTEVSDIHVENLSATTSKAIVQRGFYINGYLDKPLQNITFKNISIEADSFGSFDGLGSVDFSNLNLKIRKKN